MTKPLPATLEQLHAEMFSTFAELNSEPSDRAAAIVALAYIDDQLGAMLREFFVDREVPGLGEHSRPAERAIPRLGNFRPKLALCFAVGLIGPDLYHDLSLLIGIRDRCAHRRAALTFDDSEILSDLARMKLREIKIQPPAAKLSARGKFSVAAAAAMSELANQGMAVRPATPAPDRQMGEAINYGQSGIADAPD